MRRESSGALSSMLIANSSTWKPESLLPDALMALKCHPLEGAVSDVIESTIFLVCI